MSVIRLALLPVRVALGTARVSAKAGYRAGRLAGYRRLSLLGAGVTVGVLLAPVPGREARARLRRYVEARRVGSDTELAERVRFELSHNPQTWHLSQPRVDVEQRRVILRGEVPDDDARQLLVRAATGCPGVLSVDDRLELAATTGQ